MKIGSVNNGISNTLGYSTEAKSKPIEIKASAEKLVVKSEANINTLRENLEEKEVMTDEMLTKAIAQANKSLEHNKRSIERSVHEVTHTVMYTVKDTVTNEVIAEFPPKKIQDMIAKMWELAGLFVDEKA